MIAFVSGGARSGKSAVAERLVDDIRHSTDIQNGRGGRCYYLATARATDTEMVARIARHRTARGNGWTTLEAPVDLPAALTHVDDGSVVLLDCLTLWASQVLYGEVLYGEVLDGSPLDEDLALSMLDALMGEARERGINLVMVSNDINEGMPPQDAETWRYLSFLQRVHRRVVAEADVVIQVVAGIASYWKGEPVC